MLFITLDLFLVKISLAEGTTFELVRQEESNMPWQHPSYYPTSELGKFGPGSHMQVLEIIETSDQPELLEKAIDITNKILTLLIEKNI